MLASRENELRVEYLGSSVFSLTARNFVVAGVLAGLGGTLNALALKHVDPFFAFWTTSGEFVFVAILGGYASAIAVFGAALITELVRSYSSTYFPDTWQLALGPVPAAGHRLPAARLRLAVDAAARDPAGRGGAGDRGSGGGGAAAHRRADGGPPVSTVLEARNIRKAFGAVVAADDISVAVPAASRLALIGSNGAGKTTFVNMVTGYLKPDSGTVLLDGEDVTGLAPRRITRAGMSRSFQIPQLCEPMSPLDNVLVATRIAEENAGRGRSFFRSAHTPEAIDAAHAILARFGLTDYADQPVSELPGGVRKLIDIAMALASHPHVLLLDEPTSGVSSEEKFPIMDRVMHALEGERAAVIFVEHDMEIVTRYASRVLAFYSGQVIADDAPEAVLADEDVQLYVTGHRRAEVPDGAP